MKSSDDQSYKTSCQKRSQIMPQIIILPAKKLEDQITLPIMSPSTDTVFHPDRYSPGCKRLGFILRNSTGRLRPPSFFAEWPRGSQMIQHDSETSERPPSPYPRCGVKHLPVSCRKLKRTILQPVSEVGVKVGVVGEGVFMPVCVGPVWLSAR